MPKNPTNEPIKGDKITYLAETFGIPKETLLSAEEDAINNITAQTRDLLKELTPPECEALKQHKPQDIEDIETVIELAHEESGENNKKWKEYISQNAQKISLTRANEVGALKEWLDNIPSKTLLKPEVFKEAQQLDDKAKTLWEKKFIEAVIEEGDQSRIIHILTEILTIPKRKYKEILENIIDEGIKPNDESKKRALTTTLMANPWTLKEYYRTIEIDLNKLKPITKRNLQYIMTESETFKIKNLESCFADIYDEIQQKDPEKAELLKGVMPSPEEIITIIEKKYRTAEIRSLKEENIKNIFRETKFYNKLEGLFSIDDPIIQSMMVEIKKIANVYNTIGKRIEILIPHILEEDTNLGEKFKATLSKKFKKEVKNFRLQQANIYDDKTKKIDYYLAIQFDDNSVQEIGIQLKVTSSNRVIQDTITDMQNIQPPQGQTKTKIQNKLTNKEEGGYTLTKTAVSQIRAEAASLFDLALFAQSSSQMNDDIVSYITALREHDDYEILSQLITTAFNQKLTII